MTIDRATTRPSPAATFLGFLLGYVLVAASAMGAGIPGVVSSADNTPIAYEVHGVGDRSHVLAEGARGVIPPPPPPVALGQQGPR